MTSAINDKNGMANDRRPRKTEVRRYIPNGTLRRLNKIANKNGKNSLTDDCPVLRDGLNAPIFFAVPGIDTPGWVRCMIPATQECEDHVCLDIQSDEFDDLPVYVVRQDGDS